MDIFKPKAPRALNSCPLKERAIEEIIKKLDKKESENEVERRAPRVLRRSGKKAKRP